MTVSITALGANSAVLTLTGETQDGFRVAISDWYSTHGWTQHDSFINGGGDRCLVMKAPCAGGIAQKYVQFVITGAAINVFPYEAWNAVTHVGTNQGLTANNGAQAITLSSCKLYLFATNRYLGIMSLNGVTYSDAAFVFEVKRENPNDMDEATGLPAFYSTTITRSVLYGGAYNSAAFPRTVSGAGNVANKYSMSRSKNHLITGNDGSTTAIYPARTDTALDVADTPVMYPLGGWATTHRHQYMGRVYGLKTLPRDFGSMLDTVNVKCNSEGMTDALGTDVQHIILSNTYCRIALPA